ncbi:MAG: type II toxin-antitoxin system VapC family toxin [Burkholderiales bacterium]|nr:type II toxin-antitoxin system VapC family toxin [Burkholderiales bacterium]
MIALDTNVVVRFLVNDEAAQARRARALIKTNAVFVPMTVLLETEWVLRGGYGLPRAEVVRLLRALLGLPDLVMEDPQRIARALDWHEEGIDFADALHLASSSGAERFTTFDQKLVKAAKKLDVTKVILA